MENGGIFNGQGGTHVELAVLDRAGRLQIPDEYVEALGLKGKNKIKVMLDDGKILLVPPDKDEDEKAVG